MKLRRILSAFLCLTFLSSCFSGNQNSAVTDLQAAFQGGCSINGPSLDMALAQTQSLIGTIQDLRKANQCTGIDSALNGAQNLNKQISLLQQDPTSIQLNGLQQAQNALMQQINSTTDPTALEILTETYASNSVDLAELQGEEVTLSGSSFNTPLQLGYSTANNYVTGLQPIASSVVDCARSNPLFGAQMAAQLISVSGSFLSPQIGTALAVGGSVLSTLFTFIEDKQYSDAIDDLNLNQMTSALSCGLESISNSFCQADDMMTLTQLEECGYNPNASPDCPKQNLNSSQSSDVRTTPFWQGLDALSRSLPALQIWVSKVVSGVPPADIYGANRINDPKDARALLDHVNEQVAGWETYETAQINSKGNDSDKHLETVNALSALVSILAYAQKNGSNCIFSNSCTPTAVLTYYQSAAAILYNIVGQPMNGCSAQLGGNCLDATGILLPGDTLTPVLDGSGHPVLDPTGKPETTRTNGNGGWTVIIQNTQTLFTQVYGLVDAQVHAVLDVDPTGVLEAAKVAAGSGLPTPLDSLSNLSAFLQASHDFYASLPPSLIEGGEAGRQGTLNFISSSKTMLDGITAAVITESGNHDKDEITLKSIYDALNLAQDPNFVTQRLTLHIQEDVKTRIKAGQIPQNAADILLMNESEPASALTAVPPTMIGPTMDSLGAAKTVSQLNVESFVKFFASGLDKVIKLLNQHADQNGEPKGGSAESAMFRSQAARICILIATTQRAWPKDVDLTQCQGTFYKSDLTGQVLSFDDAYAQISTPVKGRMCSYYNLIKNDMNYTHEHAR